MAIAATMHVVSDELVIGKVAGAVGHVAGDKVQGVPIGDEVESVVVAVAVLQVLGVYVFQAMARLGALRIKFNRL